jgi:hypothetical protein
MMTFRTQVAVMLLVAACLGSPVVAAAGSSKPFPAEEIDPRLSTSLQALAMAAQEGRTALRTMAERGGITLRDDGSVVVIVEPTSGEAAWVDEAAVRALGGTVEARSNSRLRVRVPAERLLDLPDRVAGIAYLREPYPVRPLAVTSQGVGLTGADDFHDAGYYGQGVKVAVIDLGFDGYTEARAAGELANVVYTHDYTGGGFEANTVHGTGVAEIVEDMAPQASLYLMRVSDSVDLENAVQYCIDHGIRVINHSVGWYNSNYYDGTGVIAGIADTARANGILWANAAGNEGSDGHWQGDFVDADSDGYHDFGAGSDYLDGDGIDEGSRVYISAGDTIRVYMSWDDWTASDQDYDLYLYNSSGADVASSTGWQSGYQAPTEAIVYTPSGSGYFEIVIRNYDAPSEPEIELFAYRTSGADTGLEDHVATSSIITPANSANVVAVGAIRRTNWTTGPQEYFSSLGPSNASKFAASRTKPDIMGTDGVSSYTYGSFYGTSAASPHVAGAAALLLSEDPSLTVGELQAKLEADAIDMGTGGKDNVYGSGRLNLEATPLEPLRGYWRFDEGSGSTAADGSTYGNDGAIVGASWTTSVDESGALSFDGTNDYVQVPNASSLNPTSELTVEAWIKPDVLTGQRVIVEKPYTSHRPPYYQYSLVTYQSNVVFYVAVGGVFRWVSGTSSGLAAGSWNHVAGVYDGQYLRVYVDGVLKGSTSVGSGAIGGYGTDVYIGRHGNRETEKFGGVIDEVRISAEGLAPGEFNLLPPVASGAIAYWRFDEGSGSVAGDSSTYENDGTIVGASWTTSVDGSGALAFDGTSDYVQVPNAGSLNPTSELTVEAWIKPDVLTGQRVIVEKPYTSHRAPYYQYSLVTYQSNVAFYVALDGSFKWVTSSGGGLQVGSWNHVAGVYDGQYLRVYVDGVLKGSTSVGSGMIGGYGTNVYIGRHGNREAEKFGGVIDEVRISAEGLAPGEFNLLPPVASDLVGYWQLNEGSGSAASDSSTYGNDGTIVGASWTTSADESGALAFDGTDDYVQVPNAGSLNPTSELTVEAWIKPDVLTGQRVIVEKPYTSHRPPYYQYSLVTYQSNVAFYVAVNGGFRLVTGTNSGLAVGSWNHVAGVYDGQYLRVYVDGVLKGSTSVGSGMIGGYGTDVYIGRHGNREAEKFNGVIDEVRISDVGLTPGEFNLMAVTVPEQLRSLSALFVETVRLVPNPIRDASSGTFEVDGFGIEALRVQVFDLSGRRVFDSGWQPGTSYEWTPRSDSGERLANGAYLYVVATRAPSGREWISQPEKLFIVH